jgi:hypothetical protein
MYTLNIYTKEFPSEYVCSISKNTRKECMAIANNKYPNHGWDWDDKNYVKRKKFLGDTSTTVSANLNELFY